ncbi:hypothetical protein [Micromonospora sp. NPDC092111]|uniref:hypothetical protein n=1 Tax=Micromonospora sp. NPDC092111 TaxID=3364289 RepID=UPI003816B7B6
MSDVEELVAGPVPAAGPTVAEGDPDTGEWTGTRGGGFRVIPLWESDALTGVYGPEWGEREERAEEQLASLVRELARRWGAHGRVSMRVPLFRNQAGEPMPPLFQSLCDADCYGDLAVWGPVPTGPDADRRWVAVSVNQSDGDAPMVMAAVVSDQPITELE